MTTGADKPTLIKLPTFAEERGTLVVGETGREIPFTPVRFFFVHSVPPGRERGHHAVVNCDEVIVAVTGSVSVGVDDGATQQIFALTSRDVAVFLPRDTYSWQFDFSSDAVMLVLASEPFQTARYNRDLAAYRRARR